MPDLSASDDSPATTAKHSSESCPHSDGDDPRQVSWLALLRHFRLPRHRAQWRLESLYAHSCGSSYGLGKKPFVFPFNPSDQVQRGTSGMITVYQWS